MNEKLPKTLQETIKYFSDDQVCIDFVASLRWTDGVAVCPHCSINTTSFLATRKIWKCKACKKQFSVKVGTIFEDSAIKLDKWLAAMWLLANCKNGISSYELHRAIGITQKSAWFVLHRIRTAMQVGSIEKMSGTVEADETFIGGNAKNMHRAKPMATIQQTVDKIRSFQTLPDGWYYGSGSSIGYDIREKAIALLRYAEKHGIFEADAFPSSDGEIGVTFYDDERTLSIRIEPNFVYHAIVDINNRIIDNAYEINETEACFRVWEFSHKTRISSASSILR